MKFRGYKYRFRLNIQHSINHIDKVQTPHPHTLEMTLYITQKQNTFVSFERIEEYVNSYLSQFSGQYINEMPMFVGIEPTIENIGTVFNEQLKEILKDNGFFLRRFEIAETPSRIFIIDNQANNATDVVSVKQQKLELIISKLETVVSQRMKNQDTAINSIVTEKQVSSLKPQIQSNVEVETPKEMPQQVYVSPFEKRERYKRLKIAISLLLIFAGGFAVMWYVKSSNNYPLGLDLYGHLYKSDFLYECIKNGEFYPLYSPAWYNGIQPFRFWPPVPYYIMAFLQWIAGGNVVDAFVLFCGVSFIVGALGWLLWGIKENKVMLATLFAGLWFFLPDNLRVFFSEGNLPRMTVTIFLPYIFYFIWNFVHRNEKKKMLGIILMMSFVTLCHAMISAMVGVGTFIFLLVYSLANKKYKNSIYCLCGMLAGIALVGLWLYPGLTGGIMNTDSASISSILYTPATESLNPLLRLQGQIGTFYYGLAIFAISVFGILAANKKSLPGFVSLIIIFAGTTTALAPIVSKLPLSNLLWFRRFTPIAYALFLIALINWKECKKWVVAVICVLLIIDCVPSFQLDEYRSTMRAQVNDATQEQVADYYLLSDAKEVTNQRLSLLDLSTYGPFPSYYVCSVEPKVDYTFGWAWQASTTGSNIVMLNTALETSRFNYLFDRSIELGSDTVVVAKAHIKDINNNLPKLKEAAQRLGYTLIKENEQSIIFHLTTPKQFGIASEYKGIAIGHSAKELTLQYPYFEQGSTDTLDEYSFNELSKYEKIYLSGFQYNDKTVAEQLVNRLTENGVKVFIDMNRIPVNQTTNRSEFLGVTAQSIQFTNQYPDINYGSQVIEGKPFAEEFKNWNTVYLDGVTNVDAFSWFANQKLPAVGTKNNENTVFLGFNLLYHSMTAKDEVIGEFVEDILQVDENDLPKREIVPLEVKKTTKEIIVKSPVDNVNTSLAFQDNFVTKQNIQNVNNLLHVNRGDTIITFAYPHFKKGSIITIVGCIASITILWLLFKRQKRKT